MKNEKKIYDAISITDKEEVKKLLREFIIDNMPQASKNKFQMKEFICKDGSMMQLECVCMDNEEKVAVATDAHKLFVSKEYYIDKGIDKQKTLCDTYGNVVNEGYIYPNWKAVIPTDTTTIKVRTDFEQLIKKATMYGKEEEIKKAPEHIAIHVAGEAWVRLDHAKMMLRAGLDGWETPKNGNVRILIKKWDGNTLLLMPVNGDESDEETEKKGFFVFGL